MVTSLACIACAARVDADLLVRLHAAAEFADDLAIDADPAACDPFVRLAARGQAQFAHPLGEPEAAFFGARSGLARVARVGVGAVFVEGVCLPPLEELSDGEARRLAGQLGARLLASLVRLRRRGASRFALFVAGRGSRSPLLASLLGLGRGRPGAWGRAHPAHGGAAMFAGLVCRRGLAARQRELGTLRHGRCCWRPSIGPRRDQSATVRAGPREPEQVGQRLAVHAPARSRWCCGASRPRHTTALRPGRALVQRPAERRRGSACRPQPCTTSTGTFTRSMLRAASKRCVISRSAAASPTCMLPNTSADRGESCLRRSGPSRRRPRWPGATAMAPPSEWPNM